MLELGPRILPFNIQRPTDTNKAMSGGQQASRGDCVPPIPLYHNSYSVFGACLSPITGSALSL